MMHYPVFLLLASVLLGGCSWFGGEDNTEPPAELQSFTPQVQLRALWSRDTGSGTDEQLVKLVPAVFGEHVYVADRDGSVRAYLLENGKELWHSKIKAPLSAGPGVGEGLVLMGTSDGETIALSLENGEVQWRAPVSSEVLSVPKIYNGVVIVQTVDGDITGLHADTGERLWVHDWSVPVLTLRGTSSPIVVEGVVLAGFANGKMLALDSKSGQELWSAVVAVARGRSELQRIVDIDADAVIEEGVLYVCSFQGRLVAVNLSDGRLLWNRDMSAYAGIAVDGNQLYVSDADSQLWALDRRSGASLWKQDKLLRRSLTGPVVIGGYVVVGDFEGYIHIFSSVDGELVGRVRVDSAGIAVPPKVIGNRLLVLGAGGKLELYELELRGEGS